MRCHMFPRKNDTEREFADSVATYEAISVRGPWACFSNQISSSHLL